LRSGQQSVGQALSLDISRYNIGTIREEDAFRARTVAQPEYDDAYQKEQK